MENNSNSEKFFSAKEVIKLTASLIGTQPEDLINLIEDNDLSNLDTLSSFIKPFAVKHLNTLREESVNKGFRQASKKTERLWGEVFHEDISGKKLEDLFMEHKNNLATKSPKTDKSKTITIQQALNSDEVRTFVESLQKKADQAEAIQGNFDAFKTLQAIKADALNELTTRGAQFSQNPKIKKLQLQSLEDELSQIKFKRNQDGTITILDEDGEGPLYNKETASHWDFGDYIQSLSPVDFVNEPPKKDNKNTFVPSQKNGSNGNTFGYSKDQVNKFTYEDFNRVNKEGKTDEAKFIQEQMITNFENTNK
jgi:hypothetical protein